MGFARNTFSWPDYLIPGSSFFKEEDLLLMMRKVENWAHRMYPKFRFDDTLDKIEHLGRKREVRVSPQSARISNY